jgi:DNA-binding beta-propeller fold protein YncE
VEVPEPVPGEPVCEIVDPRLHSISGVVATDDGYIVVNDSQLDDSLRPIFFLDSTCAVVDEQSFFPGQPRDPEDLEFDPDTGVLWVGDIGDNQAAGTNAGDPREWITLWRVDLSGGDRTPVVHRFDYPDVQPRDAEALLLNADGSPLIVTK